MYRDSMYNLWHAMAAYRINWNVLICSVVLQNFLVMPNTENSLDYDGIEHCGMPEDINRRVL